MCPLLYIPCYASLIFQVAVSEDLSHLPMEHRGGPGPDLSHEGGPVALAQRSGPYRGQGGGNFKRQTNVSRNERTRKNEGILLPWCCLNSTANVLQSSRHHTDQWPWLGLYLLPFSLTWVFVHKWLNNHLVSHCSQHVTIVALFLTQ